MAPMRGAPLRLLSGVELWRRATAATLELGRAVREHAHWVLQLAYAEVRAAYPTAAVITVEVAGRPGPCQVVQVRDAAGRMMWPRPGADDAGGARLRPVNELLAELLRVGDVALLPGWTDRGNDVYDIDLGALSPAIDPHPGGSDSESPDTDPTGVSAVLADVFDRWYPGVVQAVREYARGLLEGRFAPLTDIARWPIVPAALGHPVPNGPTNDPLGPDEEEWTIGISSVHGLAAGVVESLDTAERHGTEDDLHLRIHVYGEELAARGLTATDLAIAFGGDVRSAAAAILHALPRDRPPALPAMVTCTVCDYQCVLATAHRHAGGWVGDECCGATLTSATE